MPNGDGHSAGSCNRVHNAYNLADNANDRAIDARSRADDARSRADNAQNRADSAYSYAQKNEKRIEELEGIVRELLRQVQQLQQSVIQGMENVRLETAATKAAVVRNTGALGKMEALRLFNEADAPITGYRMQVEQVDVLREDTERNVAKVVGKYDKMLHDLKEVNKTNHHRIGQHIYRIVDEDFAPLQKQAQSRSIIHQFQQGNMELDAHRILRRTEQLDNNLSNFREEELVPRIKALSIFADKMESRFHQSQIKHAGDVFIPSIAVCSDTSWTVQNNVQVVNETAREGISFKLQSDPSYTDITNRVKGNLKESLRSVQPKKLDAQHIAQLKGELNRLHEQGLVSADMLQGYFDYIDQFGVATF